MASESSYAASGCCSIATSCQSDLEEEMRLHLELRRQQQVEAGVCAE